MKKIYGRMKQLLKYSMVIFIIVALVLFAYGFIHIIEADRPPVVPKQDLDVHNFNIFNQSLSIIAEAYLKPEYNLIYSYDKTPITLTLDFNDCQDCPELENGLTFWFFYEKVEGSGSGGSIVSSSPDNLYRINIKPGERKTVNGWVQFTGEGVYRHALWNSTHTIRLESDEKTFTVYANHISYQIRSSIVIESFSAIAVGASFIMLAFISFQSYSNIENRREREKEFMKLLSKLDKIETIHNGDNFKTGVDKDKLLAEKRSLSEWIQFLGIKASLRTSQYMGIGSIFVVGLIGVLTIYYIIYDPLTTIIGTSALLFFYYLIISKFISKLSRESQRAENLLDDIMDGKVDGADQIWEKWFGEHTKKNSKKGLNRKEIDKSLDKHT